MDSQDPKTTATSTGHESHGVHLCHRCGWPFPNPHPSAKHRRAHKKVCGTIEGYTIEHDHPLPVSDDEHEQASDEDVHTPSPNLVKKNDDGSGRVGEKSNKSEDDVFSDAVTHFSDSGIGPRLERFVTAREMDMSMEQKGVEDDVCGSGSLKVNETAGADKNKQFNDPRSEETSNPGPVVNGNNQSGNVIPTTDTSSEAVPVGLINGLQPENSVGGGLQGEMKSGEDTKVQEEKLASVTSDTEEGKTLDCTLAAVDRQEELCDMLASEVVKHDLPSQTETLQNLDASEGINGVDHSAEISTSKTVEVPLADETHENIDASVGEKKISHSTEDIRSLGVVGENTLPAESLLGMPSVKPDESTQTLDVTDHSGAVSMVSSIDKEIEPKTSVAVGEVAGNFDASEVEKCDVIGEEKQKVESKDSFSVDTVAAPGSADNNLTPEDDHTSAFKKDVDHCEEKSNSKLLETGNEKGKGASLEVQAILDSKMPPQNSTDFPSSCAVDSEARNLKELSRRDSSSLESKDDGFEKSIEEHGTDKVTEGLRLVAPAGADAELNPDTSDVLDRNSSPTASLEAPVLPVISELLKNIHATENAVGTESADVAETASELKENNEVVPSETTSEKSISKDSICLTDPEVLTASDNSRSRDGAKASESIDTTEVTAKVNHEDDVVLSTEISESLAPRVQEASPTSKSFNVTSPGIEESHSLEDFSTSKSVEIVPSAELDGKILASDKCSTTSTIKEPVLSPLDYKDLHETSAIGDDKTVVNVEEVCGVNSKSLQAEVDDKLTKENDLSGCSSGRSDSLEANCGSVVSDTLETNSQKHKTTTEEAHPDKSDTFEPPSFMTLVQSGGEGDNVSAAAEIETVQNNQQPKSDALKAGWFPSLTNVVNESEGRKKNEEIIAKVTNWSPVKQQQHSPLKSLLNEVKSPNTKQVPAASQKVETEFKDNDAGVTTVGSVLGPETAATKNPDTNKDVEEWNSPARYPIEIKKEKKKKGRSYWVPFVCCSSVHRDL